MGQNYILTERFEWHSLRVIWTGPRSGSIISATLIGSEIATRTALLWNVRCSQTSVVVRVVTCSISKVWGVGLPMRNPHAMVERCNQGRSTIDLWPGIFGNRVIGLVYLPTPIKCATYSQLWHIVNSVSLIFSSVRNRWCSRPSSDYVPDKRRCTEEVENYWNFYNFFPRGQLSRDR